MKALLILIALSIAAPVAMAGPDDDKMFQIPICHSKRQCEVMWSEAQDAISEVTKMRNRIVTDTRIETFASTDIGYYTGTVSKRPIGKSGYQIVAGIGCSPHYTEDECAKSALNILKIFNFHVNMASGAK